MADPLRPTLMTRLRANLGHEQDARVLEALRQAGRTAYQEHVEAERVRDQLAAGGASIWDAPPAACSQLLAAWTALALQTLGEALLDAAYAANPRTVGYVHRVTFDQAWEWLSAVEPWLVRAQSARGNPHYDIAAELDLPASLPVGPVAKGCPREHRQAMLHALVALRQPAEVALFTLERHAPAEASGALDRVRELAGLAAAGADYVAGLRLAHDDERLHDLIDSKVRATLGLWYDVGQLAAMPRLLTGYRMPGAARLLDPDRLPGGKAFDPWCLTDPQSTPRWRSEPEAVRKIDELWRADPNPAATLGIKLEIDSAVEAGYLVPYRTAHGATCYFRCPWSALYEVRRPFRLADRKLAVLEQVTYDVGPWTFDGSRRFGRAIVVGPFTPATRDDLLRPAAPDG